MAGKVRAKFYVTSKTGNVSHPTSVFQVKLSAVYENKPGVEGNAAEENRIFGQWTPSASCDMTITNAEAAANFEVGKSYYVDFTPADAAE